MKIGSTSYPQFSIFNFRFENDPDVTTQPVLLDILNKAADWFRQKGIESHRLDASSSSDTC